MNTRDLKEWIKLGPIPLEVDGTPWQVLVGVPGSALPKIAEPHIIITPVGSGNLNTEMTFENRFWQVRVRGYQARDTEDMEDAAIDCEDAATAIDKYILGAPWGIEIGGSWVTHANRSGAGPTPLGSGSNDGRSDYCATYLFDTETGL